MWSPTHIQVLVKKAKNLKIKGKDGTNDAFVTIGLGKEKYQTSVKEKATESVDWCEQCELSIPQQGNTAEVVLNVLHRNFLGVDEFLGMVSMPLREFDVYERPKTKWYTLKCKPGQTKNDYRGELEVRTSFTVKAVADSAKDSDKLGSTADLPSSKNKKGSLTSLNKAVGNFGGSLLSLGQKERKNLKKIAKSVTNKVEKVGGKARKSLSSQHKDKDNKEANNTKGDGLLPNKFDFNSTGGKSSTSSYARRAVTRNLPNRDPGVNSDEEDDLEGDIDEDDMFRFDALSHRSSGSSINVSQNMGTVSKTSTPLSGSLENIGGGELLRKSFGTPVTGGRRGLAAGSQSPLVGNSSTSRVLSSTLPRNVERTERVLDEWEQKLLGKKVPAPFVGGSSERNKPDSLSQISAISSTHSSSNSRTNTLERQQRSLQNSEQRSTIPIPEETPGGRKKKIIPVTSDFEGSPSPETPSSPVCSPSNKSTKSEFANRHSDQEDEELELVKSRKKKLNFKWKSSVSFREKEANSQQAKIESSNNLSRHSRTYSDGSGSSNGGAPPPSGQRVAPQGRETTPTPNAPQRIPREVWDRFEGKSREDLIETIVQLQTKLETQGKKQVELEDYLDSLLMKVMATSPALLQKDLHLTNSEKLSPSIKYSSVPQCKIA